MDNHVNIIKSPLFIGALLLVVIVTAGITFLLSKPPALFSPPPTHTLTPTKPFTPTLTMTPSITPSPTSTFTVTPSKTPTTTPSPTQSLAFNSSFEEMRNYFEDITNIKFEYVWDMGNLHSYEGKDLSTGMFIYLFETPNGGAAGFMIRIVDNSLFDQEKAALTIYQIIDYYISSSANAWLSDNFPQEVGELNKKTFRTETGVVVLGIEKDDNSNYILMVLDTVTGVLSLD